VHNVTTWISKRDETSFYVGTLRGLSLLELGEGNTELKFARLFSNEKLSNSSIVGVVSENRRYHCLWYCRSTDCFFGI
jgi:hypothetical protein